MRDDRDNGALHAASLDRTASPFFATNSRAKVHTQRATTAAS